MARRQGPFARCAALCLLAGLGWFGFLPEARAGAAKVLLVDDDESDNNSNPASRTLSASDAAYRKLLEERFGAFDTFVVPKYSDGPPLEKLKEYSLIVWYTGASYGGNRDNTAVISLRDERTLTDYLGQGGGTVMLFSPGYLNNALGSGGAALWEKKESRFLQEMLGIKGGRGLLQRFRGGEVVSATGATYVLTKARGVEPQFSALNPGTAQVLYTAALDPDGKGSRQVPVATSQAVGSGHLVYVAFTFEDLGENAAAAFEQLLPPGTAGKVAGGRPEVAAGPFPLSRRWTVVAGEATGALLPMTSPGDLQVDVESSGAPVRVALLDERDRVVSERTGSGQLHLDHAVTAADVAVGPLWRVSIRRTAPVGTPGSASGTLAVRFAGPAPDMRRVHDRFSSRVSARRSKAQPAATRAPGRSPPTVGAAVAPFAEAQAARRARLYEAIRPQVEAMKAAAHAGIGSGPPPAGQKEATVPGLVRPPLIQAISIPRGSPGDPIILTGSGLGPTVTLQMAVGPGPFSEVHFVVVGPTSSRDLVQPGLQPGNNDGKIFTYVPDGYVAPLDGYDGYIYVRRPDGAESGRMPFHFDAQLDSHFMEFPPAQGQGLEMQWIALVTDPPYNQVNGCGPGPQYAPGIDTGAHWLLAFHLPPEAIPLLRNDVLVCHDFGNTFFGYTTNDRLYGQARLYNGWTMCDVGIIDLSYWGQYCLSDTSWTDTSCHHAGAYLSSSGLGTDRPFIDVRVWAEALSDAPPMYQPYGTYCGPRGVPYDHPLDGPPGP